MKKVSVLLPILLKIVLLIGCTDTEKSLMTDVASVPNADSISLVNDTMKQTLLQRKYIYLTIDDAPMNGSKYIDSVLRAEKVKSSLFLVGNNINGSKRFENYYKKLKENPFVEIYNHSYSHANSRYAKFYTNPQLVLEDFNKNQIEFHLKHKIARLPGRNIWHFEERKKNIKQTGATSAQLLAQNGYKMFGWDVEWGYNPQDYSPKQSIDDLVIEIEHLFEANKTFTANHVVLLLHDQMFRHINEQNNLAELISKLKENNFTFEYLSSYPDL